MTYLGIDLGTSAVKAVIADDQQRIMATGHAALEVSSPHPGWSEQSPEAWWRAVLEAIAMARAADPHAFSALRGIGLSGQMHGATLLDEQLNVLRPAILWNDTRAFEECQDIERRLPQARAISGNLMMPGFTAPKLLWVRKHERDVFDRVSKVLLPKDYIALRLSGELASDMSDAAGTMWLDVGKREWSDALLDTTHLRREQMPRLVEGSNRVGQLRDTLRRAWGLEQTVWIAGGAGDNAAAAIGMGITQPGAAMLSLGTSGVLFAATDRYLPNPDDAVHTFCHCLPERWHQMSVILSAASSLAWLAFATGKTTAELAHAAEAAKPANTPIFLPYLSGERTPHNDPYARGVFFGLSGSSGVAEMAYSVMEGVAFAIADGSAGLKKAGNILVEASFVGGGSRSALWARLCAASTGLTLHCHGDGDIGGAFGAARLARLAVADEPVSEVCVRPTITATFEPEPLLRQNLLERWARYRSLYVALKPEFRKR